MKNRFGETKFIFIDAGNIFLQSELKPLDLTVEEMFTEFVRSIDSEYLTPRQQFLVTEIKNRTIQARMGRVSYGGKVL